jgi:hypothetical protein
VKRFDVRKRSWPAIGGGIALFAAALSLLAAPAANAAIGFHGLSAKPTNLAAGANSNVNIHIGFSDPSDQVKDLTVHLPPGLVGNPTATPLCTVSQLNSDNCPANTQVGTTTANVNVIVGGVPVAQTVNGSLYNLVPQPGEPARFGIVLRPPVGQKIVQQSAVRLRPDFGLDTVINNFPREASGLEADIKSIDISLFGKANGKGFMRNPTSCVAKAVRFNATSYSGHAATGTAPSFTPTACGALPFSPKLSVELGANGATSAGSVIPVTTVIDQADGEAGLENATVLLPSAIGPTSAFGIQCPVGQFHSNASACPSGSIVGKATATSSYLSGVESGPVAVVEPAPGQTLPRLGVDLHGPLSLQLLGNFVTEAQGTGNAFIGLPDIPIAHFELRFHGGSGGLLSTSVDLCKSSPPVFHAAFAGYNGAKRTQNPAAKIEGCGGGGGAKPHASVKLRRARSRHPRVRFAIDAAAAPLKVAKLRLPKSLRLAKGKAWKRGVIANDENLTLAKSMLHHTRHSLRVTAPVGGADLLRVKMGRHAVKRTKRLVHRRLKFRVTARDVDGRHTSQRIRVRVR